MFIMVSFKLDNLSIFIEGVETQSTVISLNKDFIVVDERNTCYFATTSVDTLFVFAVDLCVVH